MPIEAIPGFIQKLQALYVKTTGQAASAKSPGSGKKSPGGPKGITKGGKGKTKVVKVAKKEKSKPVSMEDLDKDLMSYTAARGAEDAPAAPMAETVTPAEGA